MDRNFTNFATSNKYIFLSGKGLGLDILTHPSEIAIYVALVAKSMEIASLYHPPRSH